MLHASHNRAVNGEKIDFSLLLDGLSGRARAGHHHRHRLALFRDTARAASSSSIPRATSNTRATWRPAPATPTSPSCWSMRVTASSARPAATPRSAISSASSTSCSRSTRWIPSTGRRRAPRDRAGLPRHGRRLQLRAGHHHSGGGVDRRQRGQTFRADALVCRPDLARASGVGRSGSRAGRRAVPHAGAARAARVGRFPRLCRHRHVGTRQDRREDRRCAERPRRHAEAHLHHGRRPRRPRAKAMP